MTGDGSPSAGWWRSGNGEWYPPELLPPGWQVGPDGAPRSFDWAPIVAAAPAPSIWARISAGYRLWPVWAKFVPPVAALVLAGTAAAMVGRDRDGGDAVGAPATRGADGNATTSSTTLHAPAAPTVAVGGLVITAPTVGATTTTTASTSTTATSNVAPAPTVTLPPVSGTTSTTTSTTRPPTSTVPAISGTTTTVTTTTAPTTTAPTTTAPSTSGSTTTVPTTTRATTTTGSTTTTRPPTTTRSTTTTTRAPITHTVTGTLLVDTRTTVSATCGGSGSLAALQNGQAISLFDANGNVVGQSVLTSCRWTDWRFVSGALTAKPEFSFTIAGVAEVSSYTARVAGTSWAPVTLNALRNAGWRLDLVV